MALCVHARSQEKRRIGQVDNQWAAKRGVDATFLTTISGPPLIPNMTVVF